MKTDILLTAQQDDILVYEYYFHIDFASKEKSWVGQFVPD